jgi:hypothetical protein
MTFNYRIRRALFTARRLVASTTSKELAEILILCILGMLAAMIALMPGDQTSEGLRQMFHRVFG